MILPMEEAFWVKGILSYEDCGVLYVIDNEPALSWKEVEILPALKSGKPDIKNEAISLA